MPDALELLKTRRSVKPIELAGPGPTASEIETLLKVASRVPDHGKLAPWRFILFEGDARAAAGETIASAFRADRPDATPDQIDFRAQSPCARAIGDRGGEPRRSACENPGMGAGALRRRLRDEPGFCRPCDGLRRELDHRVVCL